MAAGTPIQNVAFVHDWLVTYRGGEKVLEQLLALYPQAPIYTLFYDPQAMPEAIRTRRVIYPKFLNRLRKFRKALLPILPTMIESFDLTSYDLIISTSSCVAKGAISGPQSYHIAYIHSPMRYIWDQKQYYLQGLRTKPIIGLAIEIIYGYLRLWDVSSNHRVDQFVANSSFVADRIRRYYGRDSVVVAPPVGPMGHHPAAPSSASREVSGPYFLIAGAFVSYKRFDLAIAACRKAGVALVIAGSGPEEGNLRQLADETVRFYIKPQDTTWDNLLCHAEAFIFPGTEDFGITPVEALLNATPIIAYKGGGALDFVVDGKTGLFFSEQTEDCLAAVLRSFDRSQFIDTELIAMAQNFTPEQFQKRFRNLILKMPAAVSKGAAAGSLESPADEKGGT